MYSKLLFSLATVAIKYHVQGAESKNKTKPQTGKQIQEKCE